MVCVVSWKNAVYMYFGRGGAVPPPRVLSFSKLKRASSDRKAAAGRARCDEGMGIDSRDEGFPFPQKTTYE